MKPKSYRRKPPLSSKAKTATRRPEPDLVAVQIVQNVLAELPQLVAVAVVDVESGANLAAHSTSPGFNPDTAAAYNAEVVKQKQKAIAALQLAGEKIDDILITLSSQLHLLKLTENGGRFIYLVVNSDNTNLGIAREVLRAQATHLETPTA